MILALALVGARLTPHAFASPTEFYGFGARKMGRAGAGMAIAEGTDSILSDPAALPGITHPELSVGFLVANSQFTQFPGLWWDTNEDGKIDATDPPLDAGPSYDPVHGVMIGATRPLGAKAAMGLGLFIPAERLLRLQTFDPSIPTYFLYANRTQRYEMGAGLGYRPFAGLSIGGGLEMIPRAKYSLDATLDLTVSGATSSDSSASDIVGVGLDVHQMTLDLIPGFSPNLSLHWDAGEAIPLLRGLQLGAAWRGQAGLPVDVAINLQINAATQDMGSIGNITLPLLFGVELGVFDHYVPAELNFGGAYTISNALTLSLDVRRTAWDQMEVSIAKVTHSTINGAAVDFGTDPVTDGNPYTVQLQATWAPRLGADLRLPAIHTGTRLGDLTMITRGGFGYEPTPLVAQTADSALLDADRLIFAVGLGAEYGDPFRKKTTLEMGRPIARKMRVDGFFQYHLLASGAYARPTPAVPTAGYSVDGSPIPIGGHLLAAGLQWSFEY